MIIHLEKFRKFESFPPIFVRKWVRILCTGNSSTSNLTDSMIRSKVEKVLKTSKSLSNRKKLPELNDYLLQPFIDNTVTNTNYSQPCQDCQHTSSNILNLKKVIKENEKHLKMLPNTEINLNDELKLKNEIIVQ